MLGQEQKSSEFCQREDRVEKCAQEKVALKSAGFACRGGRKELVGTVSNSEAQCQRSSYLKAQLLL